MEVHELNTPDGQMGLYTTREAARTFAKEVLRLTPDQFTIVQVHAADLDEVKNCIKLLKR